ncbi:hypothetical protein V2A60_000789 [Cordyceps javanica]
MSYDAFGEGAFVDPALLSAESSYAQARNLTDSELAAENVADSNLEMMHQ